MATKKKTKPAPRKAAKKTARKKAARKKVTRRPVQSKRKPAKKAAKRRNAAQITRAIAMAAGKDAANRQMKKAARCVAPKKAAKKNPARQYDGYVESTRELYQTMAPNAQAARRQLVLQFERRHGKKPPAMELKTLQKNRKYVTVNPRKNPSGSLAGAARLYKKFIGKAPTKVTTVRIRHRGLGGKVIDVAKLGEVNYLKLRNPNIEGGLIRWGVKERPMLTSTPNGRQYLFVGGNQNLSKVRPVCDVPARKSGVPLWDLGEVVQIEYHERKAVEDFRPVNYYHNFGEENGKRPHLMYDRLTRTMHLVGGDYRTLWNGINN